MENFPLDCWTVIIEFINNSDDFLNLLLTNKELYRYITKMRGNFKKNFTFYCNLEQFGYDPMSKVWIWGHKEDYENIGTEISKCSNDVTVVNLSIKKDEWGKADLKWPWTTENRGEIYLRKRFFSPQTRFHYKCRFCHKNVDNQNDMLFYIRYEGLTLECINCDEINSVD
jgi:hypothetical protein